MPARRISSLACAALAAAHFPTPAAAAGGLIRTLAAAPRAASMHLPAGSFLRSSAATRGHHNDADLRTFPPDSCMPPKQSGRSSASHPVNQVPVGSAAAEEGKDERAREVMGTRLLPEYHKANAHRPRVWRMRPTGTIENRHLMNMRRRANMSSGVAIGCSRGESILSTFGSLLHWYSPTGFWKHFLARRGTRRENPITFVAPSHRGYRHVTRSTGPFHFGAEIAFTNRAQFEANRAPR